MTTHRASALGAALLILATSGAARAQVFRSGVDMVALTVTVTDEQGHSVRGLDARHFAVFEDGIEQEVSLFGGADVPLDVALIADTSGSMVGELPHVQDGALALLDRLRPGDRAMVISIRSRVDVTATLDGGIEAARTAIRRLHAAGTTALYDGVYIALRQFQTERERRPERRRQALVVFSDGDDNSSHVVPDDLVALARAQDVTIYTITLQNPTIGLLAFEADPSRRWQMRALSQETGGMAFFPTQATAMRDVYDRIARELVSQYALAYVAPPGDARSFRRVSVRLRPPAQGAARTRTGYVKTPVVRATSRRTAADDEVSQAQSRADASSGED